MHNIKLTLEYDGTNYVGWQIQQNGPSIQGAVEKALKQLLQDEVGVIGAGRTDSGVHARGQVANFKTSKENDLGTIGKGLNALLPHDIVVLSTELIGDSFHARYNAKGRIYKYYLSLKPTALLRNYSWYVGGYRLDLNLMRNCSELILGEHDFASFCKVEADVDHHRCIVEKARWEQDSSMLVFEISANRFLHGMVRALIGTMVEIGRGHRLFDDFQRIIEAKDRRVAGMAAPAKGLFLERIIY